MGIFADIKEDFSNAYKSDPALNSRIDFLFNYPGVWAVAWYRLAHRLYKKNLLVPQESLWEYHKY